MLKAIERLGISFPTAYEADLEVQIFQLDLSYFVCQSHLQHLGLLLYKLEEFEGPLALRVIISEDNILLQIGCQGFSKPKLCNLALEEEG